MNHSTIAPKPVRSFAQANRPRSGERGPLAQAKPFSPRREHDRETMGSVMSHSGEPLLASARLHLAKKEMLG